MVSQNRLLIVRLRLFITCLLLSAFWGECRIAVAQDETPPSPEVPIKETPATTTDVVTGSLPAVAPEPESDTEIIPQAYPEDRYVTMWDKNPFLLKTAVIEQKTEDFAKDWALSGISATSGVYTVRIFNKQTGKFERLKQGSPGGSEFQLVNVTYDKDRSKSSVKVSRGTETAELKYDDSLMSRPVTIQNNAAGGGQGQNPAQPNNPNLPPGLPNGAPQNIQRGPNGQPITAGPGAQGRPGTPITTSTRGQFNSNPGGNNPTNGAPVVNPATGFPVPTPGYAAPPAPANAAATPPVSRRRQLIPAPIQQSQ